jgi:hypothetical protein
LRRVCSNGTAGQAHKDTHTDRSCKCDKRPVLDLIGEATQCIITEFRRFVAHGMRAATKAIGDAAQHGGDGRPDAFDNLCRARGCAVAHAF